MNLLQKQGFYNTITLYAGTALGFFNLIILFQRFLSIEQIGFFLLMNAICLLYAQIASFGINNVILKFFPYYRSEDKNHGGFITFVIIWCVITFTVFTIIFLLFKNQIIVYYSTKPGSSLLVKYFYFLIPLSFLTLFYTVLESIALTIFKNVLSSFLREVILRLFTTFSVLLIAGLFIDYHEFLIMYVVANAAIIIILFVNIYKEKQFKLPRVSLQVLNDRSKFINYGVFTLLSSTSYVLIQNLDIIMLSILSVESLKFVGIYSTFFSIAMVISLPAKALSRTSLQIVSQAWVTNDLEKIGRIYYKTSVVQMLIGCLLFIGLVINRPFIILLLHKPEYANYFNVFIVVGIGFLVDMTGGLNGYILNVSKYYRFTTYLIGAAVLFCLASNWFLIPVSGMMGAAMSYAFTIFLLNLAYFLIVKIKFGLQPFAKAHLYIIGVGVVCLFAGLYLPVLSNIYLDMIYRSLIVTIIYCLTSYKLRISDDINEAVNNVLMRISSKRSG